MKPYCLNNEIQTTGKVPYNRCSFSEIITSDRWTEKVWRIEKSKKQVGESCGIDIPLYISTISGF